MAGYWPRFFVGFFFGQVKVHKHTHTHTHTHTHKVRPISSHLDQTSLVNKGFIIWPKDYPKEFNFCGNKVGNPE